MVEIVTKAKRQRTPKSEPYSKINSYSLPPSKQQIITAILCIAQVVIHQVFVSPSIEAVAEAILWTIFGFRYGLMIILVYDYVKLTVKDPVDRLIIDPQRRYKYNPYELRRCSICVSTVQCSSHHCMTCNRCTEDFDHHCKYLNNCIGVRNYEYFIRLLLVFILFSILSMVMGIWVLIENSKHEYISETKKWVILVYVVVVGIIGVVVAGLLGFHVYISCCANITTLEFITSPKQQEKPALNVIVIEPTPLSAEHFRKTFEGHTNKPNFGVQVVSKDSQKSEAMDYYRR